MIRTNTPTEEVANSAICVDDLLLGEVLEPDNLEAREAAQTLTALYFRQPQRRSSLVEARAKQLRRRQTVCTPEEEKAAKALNGPSTSVYVRTGGVLRSITSVGLRAATGAGVASAVLLPAFIILGFIHGQWSAALWWIWAAAAGIAADFAATTALTGITLSGFAVGGPVGLLFVAAIGVLFAIIPGLFSASLEPQSSNVTEIVRFAFSGDKSHTGNEKRNQPLTENGQTPNCTVYHGVGALAVRPSFISIVL